MVFGCLRLSDVTVSVLYWNSYSFIIVLIYVAYCVYCCFYHCINVLIYSATKLPVCFNKLTYLLTYLLCYVNTPFRVEKIIFFQRRGLGPVPTPHLSPHQPSLMDPPCIPQNSIIPARFARIAPLTPNPAFAVHCARV